MRERSPSISAGLPIVWLSAASTGTNATTISPIAGRRPLHDHHSGIRRCTRAHIEVVARNGRGTAIEAPFGVDLGRIRYPRHDRPLYACTCRCARERRGAGLVVISTQIGIRRRMATLASSVCRSTALVSSRRQTSWWAGALGGCRGRSYDSSRIRLALVVPWSGVARSGVALLRSRACRVCRAGYPRGDAPVATPDDRDVLVGGAARGALAREAASGHHDMGGTLLTLLAQRPFCAAVAGIIVGIAVVSVVVIPHVDFIGHADYADNAVRARNIVHGHAL